MPYITSPLNPNTMKEFKIILPEGCAATNSERGDFFKGNSLFSYLITRHEDTRHNLEKSVEFFLDMVHSFLGGANPDKLVGDIGLEADFSCCLWECLYRLDVAQPKFPHIRHDLYNKDGVLRGYVAIEVSAKFAEQMAE